MKVSIAKAAQELGVCQQTLRRWEASGKIIPEYTAKGHRRYDLAKLRGLIPKKLVSEKNTVAYARVSSHDQKEDLKRQEKMLELFCASHGWKFEILADLGSGMNYHKQGLKKLIHKILNEDIERLVLTHKDRLLRFGAELIFAICEKRGIEVVLMNQGQEPSFEEELAADVLEIITVFSARLYGSRSKKNKKLIANLEQVVGNTTPSN